MARDFSAAEHQAGLTLVVKPVNDPERPVDAEQFLDAATKWLASLASFASDSGLHVRWEIAELRKSSAVLEVIPIDVITGIIAGSIARDWRTTVRAIESGGTTSQAISSTTIRDMEKFASVANELHMTISSGEEQNIQPITLITQKRFKEAVAALPIEEYSQDGSLRGNVAVLNSWNTDERWFRLRIPLAPEKQIRCLYTDEGLIGSLGDTFEKLVDVTGTMHYRNGETWPYKIHVRLVKEVRAKTLDDFIRNMRPIPLPPGADCISAIRSLRDAE